MADVEPLRALRYDLRTVGGLGQVSAPPYDVIDEALRAELASRSPFNIVELDLPRGNGGDPYIHAQSTFEAWRQGGVLVREREPSLWVMTQDYVGPDGRSYTRHGFYARVRVEDYGPGRIRPHERTQPGPKEDRLRLTRATRANLSPIFSLYPDGAEGAVWGELEPATQAEPYASFEQDDGTVNRVWRVADERTIETVHELMSDKELLIADGHHRYETARIYAEEVGGEGEHRYVLMFLCALSDPGLTIFPTHRLLSGLEPRRLDALQRTLRDNFELERIDADALGSSAGGPTVGFGYVDRDDGGPLRLSLRDQAIADRALAGHSAPYRRLDTAVLETVVLRDGLGMSEDDVAMKRGLDYETDPLAARRAVADGAADAAFFLRPTPIELVREIAESGESMPPKSTYFYPKIPTGIVFNALE